MWMLLLEDVQGCQGDFGHLAQLFYQRARRRYAISRGQRIFATRMVNDAPGTGGQHFYLLKNPANFLCVEMEVNFVFWHAHPPNTRLHHGGVSDPRTGNSAVSRGRS